MTQTNAFTPVSWPFLALQDTPVQGVLGGQTTDPIATPAGTGGVAPAANNSLSAYFPLLVLGLVGFMMFSMFLNGRKDKKKRAEMLSSLGKRDRVQTVGGVIGTIVEIKGDEFLIESDRASNTRLWVTRASVSTIIRSGGDRGDTSNEKATEGAGV